MMTDQEQLIIKELALGNNLYSLVTKCVLNGEVEAQEAILLAHEQSYHLNPKSPWSGALINELKAYARLHVKPESIWNSIEEFEEYINDLVKNLKENMNYSVFDLPYIK